MGMLHVQCESYLNIANVLKNDPMCGNIFANVWFFAKVQRYLQMFIFENIISM